MSTFSVCMIMLTNPGAKGGGGTNVFVLSLGCGLQVYDAAWLAAARKVKACGCVG